jgi:hypothetical protein
MAVKRFLTGYQHCSYGVLIAPSPRENSVAEMTRNNIRSENARENITSGQFSQTESGNKPN